MSAETPNVPPIPIEKPLQELSAQLTGDVDSSDQARYLYSTDASIYQVQPTGVVAPATREDVRAAVKFARNHETSIVARGAGSSLTGNAVGEGIVVDTSRYLDEIVEIDAESETVRVQPGVVLDDLNDILSDYGLYFPPDPSTSSTCTIGGMVANDAAGPHSVKHGTTRENVRAVECVLADGRVVEFDRKEGGALTELLDEDTSEGRLYREVHDVRTELSDEIASQYPDVERNSSGYDLQSAVAADGSWIDLANLIVGSEGTLAFISEVTLELTERPETRAATLCFYEDVISAATAVAPTLQGDPNAVELIDDTGGVPDVSETVASFLYDRVIKGDLSVPSREMEDKVAFHGHCHSKAKGWDHAPVALLRHAGYDVTPVDTTCCGMAGAFGYETEHYELSMTLGDELEANLETVDSDRVAAPGASCGQQLEDRDIETEHPMELLAEVIV